MIDKIIKFIIENGEGRYSNLMREDLEEALKLHKEYGTLMTVSDDRGLTAIARWNWVDRNTAWIMDVVIRKDVRQLKSLKSLLMLGLEHNPNCKYIVFERLGKYPYREKRKYNINKFLRR